MNILDTIRMGIKMFLGFLAAFFAALLGHAKKDNTGLPPVPPNPPVPPPTPPPVPPTPGLPLAPNTTNYTVESWRPFVNALVPAGMPVQFIMNFINKESGGRPCAFGSPGAKGPDGHPLEQGIGQFYNPDDMKLLAIPSGAFRKYCRPDSQVCTRPLTQAEMVAQTRATIGLIQKSVATVRRILLANGAGALKSWSPSSEDYWRLVKLVHGLPGLANGMAFVTRKLNRAPTGWAEFKDQISNKGVKLDSGTEKYRARFPAIFKNAEDTADGVGTAVS